MNDASSERHETRHLLDRLVMKLHQPVALMQQLNPEINVSCIPLMLMMLETAKLVTCTYTNLFNRFFRITPMQDGSASALADRKSTRRCPF